MSRVQRFNFEFIIFVAIKSDSLQHFLIQCFSSKVCSSLLCRLSTLSSLSTVNVVADVVAVVVVAVDVVVVVAVVVGKKSTPSSSTVHGSETFFFFFSVTTTRFKSKLARLSVIEADKSMSAQQAQSPTGTDLNNLAAEAMENR